MHLQQYIMSGTKRHSPKPDLTLEIQEFQRRITDFKEPSTRNEVALKPLRSAKNMHEARKFNFQETGLESQNLDRKLRKLRQLEQEKQYLMESLDILKVSAVSAIAEKDDQIEKLLEWQGLGSEEKIEFYETKMELMESERINLEQEREELLRSIASERNHYICELEEKEDFIDMLQEEIRGIRSQLEHLEKNDLGKTRHIKILQEENSKLIIELQMSSLHSSLRDRQPDLDETLRANRSTVSVTSSFAGRSVLSMLDCDHPFQSEFDRTYVSEKLEQIDRVHKEQVSELRCFYEKRIDGLRKIYEHELKLHTEEDQPDHRNRSRSGSIISSQKSYQMQRKSRGEIEGLHLNIRDMHSIQENVEELLETSRSKVHDLKYEIQMQNLSDCPELEPRLDTNEDAQSQFTTKYFENPFRFMKKNRSAATISEANENETKTIIRQKRQDHIKEVDEVVQKEKGWQKSLFFAAGLFSGVTITSLVGYFLKKN